MNTPQCRHTKMNRSLIDWVLNQAFVWGVHDRVLMVGRRAAIPTRRDAKLKGPWVAARVCVFFFCDGRLKKAPTCIAHIWYTALYHRITIFLWPHTFHYPLVIEHNYGKSPSLLGMFTLNGDFPWLCKITRGYIMYWLFCSVISRFSMIFPCSQHFEKFYPISTNCIWWGARRHG